MNILKLPPVLSCLALFVPQAFADDLTVLETTPDGISPKNEVHEILHREFLSHLDRRRQQFESLSHERDLLQWQRERREFFLERIGGLPERTPLNPEIVGTLQGEGYRIEKILIESRPGLHVTANLYLPETEGPYPAVLIPCGHSHNGKAGGFYQRASILMAKNGMAALCYDPMGQGERYQMIDRVADGEYFLGLGSRKLAIPHPRVRYLCTIEHTAMGLGCDLLGSNFAQFRIWDGMRCIDYLQSRVDIIADKIGCTGNSGGGTLTAYLMALDDRITAAAPGCFLTTFRKLIETKGAQDGEQNLFGQIAFGFDEPDLVMIRAPKPTLILAATRDATFDIEGTWDLFRQSKRFYTRLGFPERVQLTEADAPHGFYLQQREAAARFLHRWLLDEEKDIREMDPRPDPLTDEKNRELSQGDWSQEDLYCTPEGQVLLMEGERSVFDLNLAKEEALRPGRIKKFNALSDREKRDLIRSTIGSTAPTVPNLKVVGTVKRAGYRIEKLIFGLESGLRLAALRFVPAEPNGKAILFLHGESMKTDAGPGGRIEHWVREGSTVLAAELRGIGETELTSDPRDWAKGQFGPDWQAILLAYLNGRSFTGMRTGDTIRFARSLKNLDVRLSVTLVATGEASVPALHAAALHPDLFEQVRLERMLPSWTEILTHPERKNQAIHVVHGALLHYDLPDLIHLAGDGNVEIKE